MDIVTRAKNICLTPNTEWSVIAEENAPTGALLTGYVIPLAAIGAVVSIIRGVIAMLRANRDEVDGKGVSVSGLQQNRMMWRRIQFQAAAVVLAILFLMIARGHAG